MRFYPHSIGTTVRAEVGMPSDTSVFMIIWFAGVAVFQLAFLGVPFGQDDIGLLRLMPLGMIGFGVGLVGFGRWLSRGDEAILVDFVSATLNAHPAEGAP